MKKIKLFIDADALVVDHFSGVGHSLLGITKALERRNQVDNNLDVILFAPKRRLHRLNEWGFQSVNYKGIPLPRRGIMALHRRQALPPLDLLLGKGVYFFPNFLNWPLLYSKSITLVHDISFEVHPEFVDPPNQRFLSENVPKAIKRTDIVASVSPNSMNEVHDHYKVPKTKLAVLPNAVDRSLFYKRDREEVKRIKAKYGVTGDYFIFVGNMEPRKNLVNLIQAYRNLPRDITSKVGLLLIGGGGWSSKDIFNELYQARYDGYKIMRPDKFVLDEDLPALYTGAKALVYPPVYEGFGIPPLEAMACETPVISTNVEPLPWVVNDAALMVNPYKKESITNAMKDILNEKISAPLIRKGKIQVKQFHWQQTADILVDELIPRLYQERYK
jgi:glycosyltransferase involved in cell wall biosynthesis